MKRDRPFMSATDRYTSIPQRNANARRDTGALTPARAAYSMKQNCGLGSCLGSPKSAAVAAAVVGGWEAADLVATLLVARGPVASSL